MSKRTAVRDLKCSAIEVKSQNFDWTEGYGETWEYWEACNCSECSAIVLGREGDRHSDVDSDSECSGSLSGEGPMMNYWYPIEIDDVEDAARKLIHLPLCVVKVGDETGLALTGGGMNLAWEICEAFITLGYLPPTHFCDLPGMAGKDVDSKRNRHIIAACLRSYSIQAGWAKRGAERLRETIKRSREFNARDRKAS